MTVILINLLLAFAWAAVSGDVSLINVAFGFVLGGICLALIRDQLRSGHHFRRILWAADLSVRFVWELIKSSVNVAIIVLSPRRVLQPAIIAYPLDVRSDAEITLLANLITLTPGTLSIDVSEDTTTLYVHAIDAPDTAAVIDDIKSSFEWRIARVFNS